MVVRRRIGDVICVLDVRDDLVECDDDLELGAIVANAFCELLAEPEHPFTDADAGTASSRQP